MAIILGPIFLKVDFIFNIPCKTNSIMAYVINKWLQYTDSKIQGLCKTLV